MIVDLGKIPSTCIWSLGTHLNGGYTCRFTDHSITGRSKYIHEIGATPQEAVDKAIESFMGVKS